MQQISSIVHDAGWQHLRVHKITAMVHHPTILVPWAACNRYKRANGALWLAPTMFYAYANLAGALQLPCAASVHGAAMGHYKAGQHVVHGACCVPASLYALAVCSCVCQ